MIMMNGAKEDKPVRSDWDDLTSWLIAKSKKNQLT